MCYFDIDEAFSWATGSGFGDPHRRDIESHYCVIHLYYALSPNL